MPDLQQWQEAGRLLFAKPSRFTHGAAAADIFPPEDIPEIALIGRSNVGKSSLINAMTGQKGLARTSNTPGRTQQINFFEIGEGAARLVDLPGYGFAKASKEKVWEWNQLIGVYLTGRSNIILTIILVDARHGFKDSDIEMMGMLDEREIPYAVILTKADKIPEAARTKRTEEVQNELGQHESACPDVYLTSAAKNTGIAELRAFLACLINEKGQNPAFCA